MLPDASRTRSTSTYVPGFSASVLKRKGSVLLSNRPPVGKTFTHFLPFTANDAAVRRTSGDVAVASTTAWSPSTPTTFTVTTGGVLQTTKAALVRSPVSAAPSGLSLRSLATTLRRYRPDGAVCVSQSY